MIDYSNMTLDELKALKKDYTEKAKLYDIKQYAMKISLNSVYGANANRFFKYYSLENASAITNTGQIVIQTATQSVNDYMNKILKTQDVDYVSYVDTDSVAGSSIIEVNGAKITIEEYFNNQSTYIKRDEFNENYVKIVSGNDITPSLAMDTGKIEYKNIKYVMKHKVKKRMFRISYDNKEVVVTEDHSIIVKRNKKFKSIKPKDLRSEDKIIIL